MTRSDWPELDEAVVAEFSRRPAATFVLDDALTLVWAAPVVLRRCGVTADGVRGIGLHHILDVDESAEIVGWFRNVLHTRAASYSAPSHHTDGIETVHAEPLVGRQGRRYLGVEQIASTTSAPNNDRGELAVLALVTDVAEIGTWDWNRETGEIWWNTWHERLLGYEPRPGPRSYAEFRDRIHPDDIERLERDIQDAVATGQLYQCLFRALLPDGTIRHLRGQGRVLVDEPYRMVGVLVDITRTVYAAERERDLLRDLRTADRRARLGFAADIHDGPLQRLFAAKLSVSSALTALTGDRQSDERVERRLLRCVDAIDEAQQALRTLLTAMHTDPAGSTVSLADELRALAADTFTHRAEITIVTGDDAAPPTVGVSRTIIQIAGEALLNIRKHAGASTVTIDLAHTTDTFTVQIADDGIGFDPARSPAGHYGLTTMANRAANIGGRCEIDSHPDHGTSVRLVFPIHHDADVA